MYRLSLAALWAGVAMSAAIAATDAIYHLTGNARGLIVGAIVAATCFVGALLRIGLHELNETAVLNRGKSEELRDDVDRVRCQVGDLNDEVVRLEALVRAKLIKNESEKADADDAAEAEVEQDAVVYQFRVRHPDGREAIVGSRTPDPIDEDEIWAYLDDNAAGTLPGRASSS